MQNDRTRRAARVKLLVVLLLLVGLGTYGLVKSAQDRTRERQMERLLGE